MNYDDTFNSSHTFDIDIGQWDPEHQAFWTDRLGRRHLLSVVPKRARRGKILEIGAAWYNKYQTAVVGEGNELTIIDIKPGNHPDIAQISGLDRYIRLDMTGAA